MTAPIDRNDPGAPHARWVDSALALRRCPRWRWRVGVLPHWPRRANRPPRVALENRIVGVDPHHGPWTVHGYADLSEAVPDLRDWPTVGALLGLLDDRRIGAGLMSEVTAWSLGTDPAVGLASVCVVGDWTVRANMVGTAVAEALVAHWSMP